MESPAERRPRAGRSCRRRATQRFDRRRERTHSARRFVCRAQQCPLQRYGAFSCSTPHLGLGRCCCWFVGTDSRTRGIQWTVVTERSSILGWVVSRRKSTLKVCRCTVNLVAANITANAELLGTHFVIPWFETPITYDVRAKPRNVASLTGTKGMYQTSFLKPLKCQDISSRC